MHIAEVIFMTLKINKNVIEGVGGKIKCTFYMVMIVLQCCNYRFKLCI